MNRRTLFVPIRYTALLFAISLMFLGCGSGERVVPVEGRVTLDGKPFEKVQVLFYVPGKGPETNYTAITDADGRFRLVALKGKRPGVAPGPYSVALTTAYWADDALETDPEPRELVPVGSREHEFEVPDDGTKEANFELSGQ